MIVLSSTGVKSETSEPVCDPFEDQSAVFDMVLKRSNFALGPQNVSGKIAVSKV